MYATYEQLYALKVLPLIVYSSFIVEQKEATQDRL